MHYKIIVAVCKGLGIGYKNTLPWRIKEDLRHFSKVTKGSGNNAIIMGKNTWDSLGRKPLPNREHYIISSSLPHDCEEGVHICKTIAEVDELCTKKQYDDVWIIGGSSVYRQYLERNIIDECIVTYINDDYMCDTFFPQLPIGEWNIIDEKKMENASGADIIIKHYKALK